MKFMASLLLAFSLIPFEVFACSRVLWNNTGSNTYVGRNMDWFEDMKSNMWVLPRSQERSGLTKENPHQWKSKYGSLIISGYDSVSVDGINEQGLAMHVLYLPETEAPKRDTKKPGLTVSLWGQYYLDNFKTVQEVADFMKDPNFQLVMTEDPASKKKGTIHLALDDASGDSLILELVKGKVHAYHSKKYTVMTNQPTFPKQLANLKQYEGLGGKKPLPGSHQPIDRFVRGAFYLKNLPTPKDQREAVAALMSVMRNTAAPFGLSSPERPNVSTTIWRTVEDLNERTIYYDSVMSPSVFWVSMKNLNFDEKAPVMKLQVADNYELSKEVSSQFKPAEMFQFIPEITLPKKLGSR